MNLMVSLRIEKAYIFLGEVIGDTQQKYILTIAINELMKSGSDYYDPMDFGHVYNRNAKIHIINELTTERYQPI